LGAKKLQAESGRVGERRLGRGLSPFS
jgi:hypothetical protein